MANDEEDIDLNNEEVDEVEELPEVQEGEEDTTDWKALALKNQGIAKRLKTKLDKSKVEVKPEVKPEIKVEKKEQPVVPDVKSTVQEILEQRDLEALEVSEGLKKEIQTYAKLQGISVKKAEQSEYIQFLKGKEDQKVKLENANLPKGRKGTAKVDYSQTKATDFNLTTPEGRQGFKEYKEWLKSE